MRQLSFKIIEWPAKGEFRISRSALTVFTVVQVTITENGITGKAECRPYGRYDETASSVIAQIESARLAIEAGASYDDLYNLLASGAARNALDCALWDLKAKIAKKRVWDLLDIPAPRPRKTAFTLSLDTPAKMAVAAKIASGFTLLKIKIGAKNGLEASEAILKARPDARLIIDANEALDQTSLAAFARLPGADKIAMIEQPFPAADDRPGMFGNSIPLTICADESLHTSKDLSSIWAAGYRAVNVKLDKTGGLSEALKTMRDAKQMGFEIMAGCMVGSSLAMAPMAILESFADYIDLDGPLLLDADVDYPILYKGEIMEPPSAKLWG